ncbi:MAG TPA: metallophosphoesterase [Myxococcota bacterium]|nr:metallophosphoesterase [Myxococcota bacterium]
MKSIETKYLEARAELLAGLGKLNRRQFMKVAGAAAGAALAQGVLPPHSFTPVRVARAATGGSDFTFAYISDSHLYTKDKNDRFVRGLLRAVDDVNRLDPQPDFVLYGGDLAQLGRADELDLGAQILRNLKAPVKMMVGEHDWYFDLGEKWRALFGADNYSFEHKGVRFVTLNSVVEADFWTAKGLTPAERMGTVAGLDNGTQSSFTVGEANRAWLAKELEPVKSSVPLVVFSHSPLYKLYKKWNFWTDDAEQVQDILKRFDQVTVIHGHTHQLLTNRIGNISFHGMLSTAWPWPYAPQGLPELTIQMSRPDPFNPSDGCGDGTVTVGADGMCDKLYNLWNRNPVTVSRTYMKSNGKEDRAAAPKLASY